MISLFFSLVTDSIFISLFSDEKTEVVAFLHEKGNFLYSEDFVSKLASLLKKNGISVGQIEEIFFLSGPGRQTGERISLSFVTTIKFLNPSVKIFFLSSLSFQAGLDTNCLSSISIGKSIKKNFLNVYRDGKLTIRKEKITDSELEETKKEFKNFLFLDNFKNIDFLSSFLLLRNKFLLFKEIGVY